MRTLLRPSGRGDVPFAGLWTSRAAPWLALGLALMGAGAVRAFVDLTPRVEGEFFFSADDPQLRATEEIAERFPSSQQIVARVADATGSMDDYRERIGRLTDALLGVDGVTGGYSIATDDPRRSPMFARLLLTPDSTATNIVLQTDGRDPALLVPELEAVTAGPVASGFDVVMSGVPVIVELIRRSLFRDLVVFSVSAVLVFGLLVALVYREAAIVVGTLATCLVAVSATLLVVQGVGVRIGLLTANLITIVFVLTLSHVVFLTANWRRASGGDRGRAFELARTLRETFEGSFWSMATTLMGFLSLLIASARPLRELGLAGAIGAVTAMIVAYSVYPAFLGRWGRVGLAPAGASGALAAARGRRGFLPAVALVVVAVGAGALRLDTDPGLLTYFAPGSELRDGLERIDRDGGSSPLDIEFRDAQGGRIDSPAVFERMKEYQATLEADAATGVVLSPAVLLEHARTLPLARFLSLKVLLDLASSQRLGGVGRSFVTPERDLGHYLVRMKESVDEPSRDAVMERVRGYASDAGLDVVALGGLYDLQSQLGALIASSLRIGIGGLLALFLVIAFVVSRSPATTVRMWLCLVAIPLVVLGVFGHLEIAVDIITSPAANVALAMGVDSMIHLVVRVRRLRASGEAAPWSVALAQIRGPVLAASGIICAGFGIFALSTFPPTQRFGFAVILGTLTAAFMTLGVLPRLAAPRA
jgi:uncharacterized protein